MSRLQVAIMTNNEDVRLLTSGNIAGALRAFQSAMAIMKEAASSPFSELCRQIQRPNVLTAFLALNNATYSRRNSERAQLRLRHTSFHSKRTGDLERALPLFIRSHIELVHTL